jgi:hypothetical protein
MRHRVLQGLNADAEVTETSAGSSANKDRGGASGLARLQVTSDEPAGPLPNSSFFVTPSLRFGSSTSMYLDLPVHHEIKFQVLDQ